MSVMSVPEKVLAAATGSHGGLGKIGTLAATSGVMYVCADAAQSHYRRAYWRVQGAGQHTLTWYRSRSRVDSVAITLGSWADTETAVLNGLTLTAETTAADAAWAARKFNASGDDSADAAALAAMLNADNTITPNGSVTAGDTITVAASCDGHGAYAGAEPCPGHSYVYTAVNGSPDYSDREFDMSGNQAAELASIVLALNHRRNFKLATVLAGTTVTIERPGQGKYTYTAHADTTSGANFSIAGTNAQDAAELAIAINTQSATHGYTATVANTDEVHISRNSARVPEPILSASASTVTCTNVAGGVPGVVAAATGATGELAMTPTWVKTLAVTTSNGTRLPTVDIDVPGVLASANSAVVTLTPGTPGSPVGGEMASGIYAVTGTAAGHCAVANNTDDNLVKDYWNTAVTGIADNSATAGTLYKQDNVEGWPYLYCAVTNTVGSPAAYVVGCTLV